MKSFWDQRYSSREYVYGTEPNTRFRRMIDALPAGRILLPGEGEGRNAVYAAAKGWEVVALDQSSEGRCKALNLAKEKNVILEYRVEDLDTAVLPPSSFDLVSLVFVHLPPDIRPGVHSRLIQSLRPGGIFHMLAFRPAQLEMGTGGPRAPELLYSRALLEKEFASLRDLQFELIEEHFEEGSYHQGLYKGIEMTGKV
jgi:SAM-dependent methyltransferase